MKCLKKSIFKIKKFHLLLFLTLSAFLPLSISMGHNTSEPLKNGFEGGDFTLRSADGPLSLKDLRGSVVLIFFGYTACATVCPVSLATISYVYSKMSPEELKGTKALFISLDPERDNPERLKKYTNYFHPNITGLTDEISILKKVTAKYGLKYEKTLVPDSSLGYVISHSSDILIVDQNGTLRMSLPHDTQPEKLLKQVKLFL